MKRKGIRYTKQKIEDSIGLRATIFYLIIVATTSVWYFVGLSSLYVVSIIFITAIGYIFSYLQRRKNNVLLKILMTFGMIYLLRQFFIELIRNPFDPRIPLATFLINLNAVHSFDLPTRLDLSFSFFVSFILMVIAGIFARESIFIVFLLFFMIGVIITLSYLNNYKVSSKYISGVLLCVSFVGFLIFPIIPKNINIGFRQDIMSQVVRRLTNLQGELRTPYSYSTSNLYRLPEGRSIPPLPFNPEEYFGFAPFVDLRQRGNLSSALVFRVLTPWGVYHRGLAFDTYNGFGWYQNEEKVQMLNTAEQPFILNKKYMAGEYLERATYFVERDMPSNIIFIPKNTGNLYFPSPIIYVDSQEGYRAPFEIPKGLIYSSFYSSSFPSAEELLNAKAPAPNEFKDYLQLPIIPKRVIDLTLNITKDYNTSWEKLTAIKNYLEDNLLYSLDIPPLGENEDAVDNFLFVTKRGYCEQFATAFTVMARIIGIPSRFITGYGPGDLNPWTGMYEVRVKNAHAWVEVYLDPLGWIPVDPTPLSSEIVTQRSGESSFNFINLIFNSLVEVFQNLFLVLYNFSSHYLYIVIPIIIVLIIFSVRALIIYMRAKEEDRIFSRVMRTLKRRHLIEEDISLYNMIAPLGDDGKEFVSTYYALKFAPLDEEQKKIYRTKLKEYAQKLISSSRSKDKIQN